jgi:hypothetical protein
MMIALFNPGHLPIDLSQDRRSALLGAHNGVMVRYRRQKITIVVARLELDTPNATTKAVLSLYSQKTEMSVHLL